MTFKPFAIARGLSCAVVGLFVIVACSAFAQDSGRGKLLPDAMATDCVACHAGNDPLPADHPDIKGMAFGDCAGCHAPGSSRTLSGRMPLFHAHLLSGLKCASCHADPKAPVATEADVCMGCHNPDKLAAKTAATKPRNPHNSPHYGKTADCNLCHHQHEKSENYCTQCHSNFNFNVP